MNDSAAGSRSSQQFFDQLSPHYTRMIRRVVPRYEEMLWALLYYLPDDLQPRKILELGCGTGNLSALLTNKYPEAEITLVDLSGEQLNACRERFSGNERLHYLQSDFRELPTRAGHYDLVASSIAIHHLPDADKSGLFKQVYQQLRHEGIFCYSDQFAGSTPDLYAKHLLRWEEWARAQDVPQEEWDTWMDHQRKSDFHAPLPEQMRWLREAGFSPIDCPWRYLLWTVIQARKG